MASRPDVGAGGESHEEGRTAPRTWASVNAPTELVVLLCDIEAVVEVFTHCADLGPDGKGVVRDNSNVDVKVEDVIFEDDARPAELLKIEELCVTEPGEVVVDKCEVPIVHDKLDGKLDEFVVRVAWNDLELNLLVLVRDIVQDVKFLSSEVPVKEIPVINALDSLPLEDVVSVFHQVELLVRLAVGGDVEFWNGLSKQEHCT
jgi:hypothetical protein